MQPYSKAAAMDERGFSSFGGGAGVASSVRPCVDVFMLGTSRGGRMACRSNVVLRAPWHLPKS